jgi:hypothetical protein
LRSRRYDLCSIDRPRQRQSNPSRQRRLTYNAHSTLLGPCRLGLRRSVTQRKQLPSVSNLVHLNSSTLSTSDAATTFFVRSDRAVSSRPGNARAARQRGPTLESNGVGLLNPLHDALVAHARWVSTLLHEKMPEALRLSLFRRAQRSAELAVQCESANDLDFVLALRAREDLAICAQSCVGYLEELATIRCLGELSHCATSQVAMDQLSEIDSLTARVTALQSCLDRILRADGLQGASEASGATESAARTRMTDGLSTSK